MKPRAIVLGAQGTLGQALVRGLPAAGFDVVAAPGRAECDITKPQAIALLFADLKPAVVFNTAAYTNVDGAEDDEDACYVANALAAEHAALAARKVGAKLVHYSTDFVFDGEQERVYDEFDTPNPLSVYGRSKRAGEMLVTAALREAFVLRVGCLYGHRGRNFPSTILRRLKDGETVKAERGRMGAPTWVKPVVEASAALAHTEHFGLYHCTAHGETTWADYAYFLAEQTGVAADKVTPVDLTLKAKRPRRAILDNRMLRLRGLDTLGTWQEHALGFIQDAATNP